MTTTYGGNSLRESTAHSVGLWRWRTGDHTGRNPRSDRGL